MSHDGARGRYTGGSVAGGRYQLLGLLGEGGMASVYLGYDSALDRQVAIKTLHTELAREASFRERFRREAQAVAKLSHSNIVSVFDTGEDTLQEAGSGRSAAMPYIVMEYVEGQPLASVLRSDIGRYGAMPADKALTVTADVLAALDASHERGLVHRDIKPGNVMITERGLVKVMDFGIARAMQSGVTSMTQTGMVVGTPQYLSPEQALGRGVDARSDLYSAGIVLFQLLTGRLPFDADSPLAIAYAHVQEQPVAPSTINRSVTPAMDALVARALRKNPNERFPTAAAMREACARVTGAGQTGTPVIIQGAPPNSGAGVSSAVFPPVDQAVPAPGDVRTPYRPGAYGPPAPAGAHGQQPPGPGYGYPQVYPQHTPLPPTPPPSYGAAPAGRGGRNMPLVVGSAVAAVLAAGGLIAFLSLRNGPDDEQNAKGGSQSVSEAATPRGSTSRAASHRPPERNRTVDPSDCSDPAEDSKDPAKVQAPDLRYHDILSVKACLNAAGWTSRESTVPNGQYAEGTVLEQFPLQGSAVPPHEQDFELKVASGDPE
jgi:tRNA A-37 threonylcarbamoyl transferase component Bud32